jgi:hypothetical protein
MCQQLQLQLQPTLLCKKNTAVHLQGCTAATAKEASVAASSSSITHPPSKWLPLLRVNPSNQYFVCTHAHHAEHESHDQHCHQPRWAVLAIILAEPWSYSTAQRSTAAMPANVSPVLPCASAPCCPAAGFPRTPYVLYLRRRISTRCSRATTYTRHTWTHTAAGVCGEGG